MVEIGVVLKAQWYLTEDDGTVKKVDEKDAKDMFAAMVACIDMVGRLTCKFEVPVATADVRRIDQPTTGEVLQFARPAGVDR